VGSLTPSQAQVVRNVAGNVAKLRQASGWTQEQLAERAQLATRYLQRVERGSVNISVVVLVQLARALSVPASRLLRPARLTPARRGRPRKVPGPVPREKR
jgi:transcriptional regulator with XRE-family HTH domain